MGAARLHYWNYSTPPGPAQIGPALLRTAQIAEAGGIDAFTLMDHYFQMEVHGKAEEPMLEGYTTLGYLAAATEKMTLGLLVTGVMYRHPGLLAKIATTLDVLSGARGARYRCLLVRAGAASAGGAGGAGRRALRTT